MKKTNAMRILDKNKVDYQVVEYIVDENDLSGIHTAEVLNQDPNTIFKTLVLIDNEKNYLVCCIPVNHELDLKRTANSTGRKKVNMIPMKELKNITGYIRGGCSPIGMKKLFPTYIDCSALSYENIGISAGERGKQLFLDPKELERVCKVKFVDII